MFGIALAISEKVINKPTASPWVWAYKLLSPIVTLVPLLLSWAVSYAKSMGYVDLSYSLAFNWGLTTLLIAGMVIWGAFLIHKRDLEKEKLHKNVIKTEERFRVLFEVAPDAMIIVDRNGKIVLFNEKVQELFGYTREELTGQQVEILIFAAVRDITERK